MSAPVARRARRGGTAAALVLVAAGAVAAVPTAAVAAQPASETGGTCGSTLTAYGHRLSCLRGSSYDRVRVGPIDDTFAIRSDRAIVYTSANFGWTPISTGRADYVKWVDATSNGLEGVCVETHAGNVYYSTYDRHRGWSRFTAGCDAG